MLEKAKLIVDEAILKVNVFVVSFQLKSGSVKVCSDFLSINFPYLVCVLS